MFELDKEQQEKVKDFKNSHECKLSTNDFGPRYVGAIGGSTTYSFTPTGLGVITIVKCACGKEIDITDTNW